MLALIVLCSCDLPARLGALVKTIQVMISEPVVKLVKAVTWWKK